MAAKIKPILKYWLLALLLVGLDQLVKYLTTANLALGQVKSVITNVLSITYLQNDGAAWSILIGQRWLFILIATVAIILITVLMLHFNNQWKYLLGLSLVLAGTIGNLLDRIINGYVVDMFQLDFINFPIFNCADLFLTIGIAWLAILIIRED
ncbi:signal peptidase II [Lentilactobacillus senioris]|uniref:signal peptidase II n=1 Tax=Lentilactobacillus senioris TaxID=931534 RepID=UPI0022809A10|nr:signal peptidase II [Lentilactobacillus senioris]MCY9806855.1 signal peptidase II [Lentilactobacillus senioris]